MMNLMIHIKGLDLVHASMAPIEEKVFQAENEVYLQKNLPKRRKLTEPQFYSNHCREVARNWVKYELIDE